MINWYQTPKLLQRMFPKRVWSFPEKQNTVFLTFDDGPIPDVTPWVIDTLKEHDAKATFFCIGENVKKHPEIFRSLIDSGHSIGNHTYNHLNGWKTNNSRYLKNVALFEKEMKTQIELSKNNHPKPLFRPPFGKINSTQSKALQRRGYKIIMWDVLSGDYNTSISKEKCLQNVLQNIAQGSIVVFHDSIKAEQNLRYVLPKVLNFITEKGWKCEKI